MPETLAQPPGAPAQPRGWRRWVVYQRERFPLAQHGPLILVFSASAVCYSHLRRGLSDLPGLDALAVAFVTCLLFFLQLRIADEFKDFEEDLTHRPYRPVQRGLVRLRELAGLFALGGAVQLGLALWLRPALLGLLLLAWIYLALMSKEFFVGDWLRRRPVLYMGSHMVIMPLVDFYATGCDWMPEGGAPPGLGWFLATSYGNGLVIELGRKIRAPADEEPGVNTYSALWGRPAAVGAWMGAMAATALVGALAARAAGVSVMALGPAAMLALAALLALRFLSRAEPGAGKRLELVSGLWTIVLYLSLGVIPMAMRYLAAGRP